MRQSARLAAPSPSRLQTDKIAERAKYDERRLNKLGYKQELVRKLSIFHSFGVAISFLSPITGLTGTYAYTFAYGGPVTVIWGWVSTAALAIASTSRQQPAAPLASSCQRLVGPLTETCSLVACSTQVLVTFMNFMLALVLAEITSSFPTSGGVYFFSHRLAGSARVLKAPRARPHCHDRCRQLRAICL